MSSRVWMSLTKAKLRGIGFWSYACTDWSDVTDDAWLLDGGDSMAVFTPKGAPFKTSEALIPSKKWEAWRQGWIDARYVKYVRGLAGEKKHPDIVAEIDRLIEWVLAEPADLTRADLARKRLQARIDSLQGPK